MDLEIKKEFDRAKLTMTLSGKLDTLTSRAFDEEFRTASEGMREVNLDVSDLEYLSSAGLRSLLIANKKMKKQGGGFTIYYPQDDVMDVFKMTNFTQLIRIVRQEDEANGEGGKPELYPLRPIQRWLIDTHLQKARSTMMNVGALLRLDPSIDMERLAAALNDVIHSYDIFRCRLVFDSETGEICQRFDGELARVFVESLSDEAFEKRKQEMREPFEIINRPLYRTYLVQTATAQYFYMDFYHAVMDGMAIVMLFWRELDKRYKALGGKNAGVRKGVSYAEYVLDEARTDPEELEQGRAYWKKMLADFDEKKHLPPIDVHDGKNWESNEFETPLQSDISPDYFRGKAYTENTFFMAAAMLALAKTAGAKESLMSWVHNGRATMHERRLMGLMLNQLPIRWDFAEGQTTEIGRASCRERV